MPKKTSVKTEQVVSTAPVVDSVVDSIVDSVVAASEKKTKKSKVAKDDVKVETPVVETASLVENLENTEVETSLVDQSVEFLAKLQQLGVMISTLKAEYRLMEKKWTRDIKNAQKQSCKRKRKAGNRAPSGFVKPTKISDELASFLGKEKGTEMARTDVTREINTYIRAHKLQDKENGRRIIPDTKLATLLKLKKTDELTYFNLQKYMSPHFAKAIKVDAPISV